MPSHAMDSSALSLPSMVTSLLPMSSEIAATTPLPPTSTTPVPEDSIAKLEEVAAVPCCEPWTNAATEPVDCISKLQAVAVPSDPWGSISTRSTLATTLLSADDLDDDDDDFEDDYEEEESIIPTYCPLRYHTFPPPPSASSTPHQQQRIGSYAPAPHGYGSRPNYYSEPFPQQNCSRTGSPQHMRLPGSNGFTQWQSTTGPTSSGQQFYVPPEAAYPPPQQQPPQPPQQQQTIRCAENGKSYLELGCSSPPPSVSNTGVVPPPPFANLHVTAANLDARHPLKRCCDGRGSWCNINKNCYKDLRLKIRNLSMFKLSRFRQVSEQSLYRSVLICNTLKRIDREIETEAKEMHQAAAAQAAAAHHQYHQHLQPPHHLQHHLAQQQSTQQLLVPQQPHTMLHQQHQDYAPPVMNCARLSNMDYQVQQQPPTLIQQQPAQNFVQHVPHYQNQPERLGTPPPYLSAPTQQLQKPVASSFPLSNNLSINVNNCDSTNATTTIHPYDHYPFRESQSGRATPFPCQPVMSPVPSSTAPSTPAATQPQHLTVITTLSASNTVAAPTQNITTNAATGSAPSSVETTSLLTASTSISSADNSDSGYADDDSTRSINWSSVLSLSSQSALDPLNNNDLFAMLPPALSITNPATATPVPVTAAMSTNISPTDNATQTTAVAISGTFTTVQSTPASSTNASNSITSNSSSNSTAYNTSTSSSTATFTTLSTISSATHSLTSSYVSSMSANAAAASGSSTWEYGFLDMEFGLGSEFTELVPSCKLSSDELFKSSLTPVVAASLSINCKVAIQYSRRGAVHCTTATAERTAAPIGGLPGVYDR
ncbi:unnamed protein product [Ceratitis capitata]|uniref:(Mediterranean fruit fly) hypothetical protein n=1 Tax=Ceratitis capitata TaxID=7213 RepID=A0A811UCW4_CERCA|nr:unnamed protein product [Ceratitis capitata]